MFVAIKDAYLTNPRGEVRVIKVGQTITPAQYNKLNSWVQAKFNEVPKVSKRAQKVTLESVANQILAELAVEASVQSSTADYTQYSNVLTDC